ncbi:MAG TPA: mycofactocin system transcriptional regulator [Actinobacteria bacterium]|nr:mycofactocin system transcriptional regulator [Actinomycetota bacterium]
MSEVGPAPRVARLFSGRPPSTSCDELSVVGLQLFIERGFDQTSIDDIASAAGIGRRTFFRYFDSKADVAWGNFDAAIEYLREGLASVPASQSTMEALRTAVIKFNRLPPDQVGPHRQRIALILSVPALTARSTLRYAQWRGAIEEFAANRYQLPVGHLFPRCLGQCALGAALAAHEQWLSDDDSDLEQLLDEAFRVLSVGFDLDRLDLSVPASPTYEEAE